MRIQSYRLEKSCSALSYYRETVAEHRLFFGILHVTCSGDVKTGSKLRLTRQSYIPCIPEHRQLLKKGIERKTALV